MEFYNWAENVPQILQTITGKSMKANYELLKHVANLTK